MSTKIACLSVSGMKKESVDMVDVEVINVCFGLIRVESDRIEKQVEGMWQEVSIW